MEAEGADSEDTWGAAAFAKLRRIPEDMGAARLLL